MSNFVANALRPCAARTLFASGQIAPDFRLHRTLDQTLSLRGLRGHPVALAFLHATWSPASVEQLAQYQALLGEFTGRDAALVAISNDNIWCQMAFARQHHVQFPLLADTMLLGAVAQRYGVYQPEQGVSGRALFVIDRDGIIRWSYAVPADVNPGVDGVLSALDALKDATEYGNDHA